MIRIIFGAQYNYYIIQRHVNTHTHTQRPLPTTMIKDTDSCLVRPMPIIHRLQNNNNSTWASDTLYLYDELNRCIDIVIQLTDPHTH